jgi:ribose transport system permease protein
MSEAFQTVLKRPWIWSFVGSIVVWLGAIAFTGGYGAEGMLTAALSLAVFTVIVGVGQMFVITLGPGNVDLSLPANIGLASAVAMKTMGGDDRMVLVGLAAAIACGLAVGLANYLLIWALRIPPIIATLSASFIIQSIDISYGRGLQIKPPPGFADATNMVIAGVPLLAILTVLFTIGASVALHRTIWGRSVVAIGQNQRAARLAGLKVEPVRCATYALCGALGGLAGALLAGYFRGANVDIAEGPRAPSLMQCRLYGPTTFENDVPFSTASPISVPRCIPLSESPRQCTPRKILLSEFCCSASLKLVKCLLVFASMSQYFGS